MRKPLVFLSCGQRRKDELELGRQIYDLIVTCGYEPFYAQRRSDLRSLSEVIFDSMAASAAYIAVVHRREAIDGALYRGSLFVEQELAVAAYIRRSRELPVLFYVQRGVERSGVRSTLLLNASFPDREDFENDSEVMEHIRLELPKLAISPVVMSGPALRLEVQAAWAKDGSGSMLVSMYVRNRGTTLPRRPHLRIWVPRDFPLPGNQPGRKGPDETGEYELIERDPSELSLSLDPDRPTLLLTIPIPCIRGVSAKTFRFRLVADGQLPEDISYTYGDLWKLADVESAPK